MATTDLVQFDAPSVDTDVNIELQTNAGTPRVSLLPTTADAPPALTLEGPVLIVSLCPAFVVVVVVGKSTYI